MKKTLAMLLAMLMLLATLAGAEEIEEIEEIIPTHDELVVGSTTALSGCFFTDLWGSNTADVDVRTLLHGYNLVEWKTETGSFGIDESVVSGIAGTVDENGNRTYIVVLYDDLYYSDGSHITAKDYAFSLLLRMSPVMAELGGSVNGLDYIVGADAYKSGESNVLSGLRIISDYQLNFTIKAEYLPFFYEMALLDCNPYPISVIAPGCEVADDGQGAYIRNTDGSVPCRFTAELLRKTILDAETGYLSHPSVVSGPYVLTDYDAAAHMAWFEINPWYKGNSKGEVPLIQYLIVKHVPNEEVAEQLRNGEVGLVNKCVQADVLTEAMTLVREGLVSVSNYARSGHSFISFSCEKQTTGSEAVRKAIAHCFDKDTFIQEYVRNYGLRVDAYYGIGQWMYQLTTGSMIPPVEEPAADADAKTLQEYEDTLKAYEELTLDDLPIYDLDLDAANQFLDADGWTLNAQGGAYDPAQDAVRYKEIGGVLVPLKLRIAYPEGNAVEDVLRTTFQENLAQVGVELTVEALPFEELLKQYYRQETREYDMLYLATNFATVFDPALTFAVEDADVGLNNRTGIADEELYQLALDMRKTEPGDVLTYAQKWIAFQQRWTEVLPSITVYSNVYMDFYTTLLYDYTAGAEVSWAQAIIGAYLSDAPEVEEDEELLEDEFFDDEFYDDEDIVFFD